METQVKVSELMTPDVEVICPDDSLRTAAQMMADVETGVLPVCDGQRLVGMITDRDIAVRGVAQGRDPEATQVRELMSGEVRYCFEDEQIDEVSRRMGEWQLRRLPVVNRDKHLVGIVSLGDLVTGGAPEQGKEALKEISEP